MKIKSVELVIPIIIAIFAFTGGLFAGVIFEETDKLDENNNDDLFENNETTNENVDNNTTKNKNNKSIPVEEKNDNISVYLFINFCNGTINHYNFSADVDNVYEVLIQAADQYNFTVETTYYGQYSSYFIEKIGSKNNGENNRYWQYYLNNQYTGLGSNLQQVKNNDKIKWEFKLSKF